jgi:DNA-binding transcriptional LysR family regulator
VMHSVATGAADLGFVHCPQPQGRLAVEPVTGEEIVMIGPPGTSAPALEHLPVQAFVTYDEGDYVFATWFAQVAGSAVPPLRCAAHFEELEEVLAWVAAGRGWSIVPADCAAAALHRGELALLQWPARRCRNVIHAIRDPAAALSPAAEKLLRLLRGREDAALSDA